jgi:hypothetical protein
MLERSLDTPGVAGADPELPRPAVGSRWRWATPRRALVGGGVLAAAFGLGSVAAGATTTNNGPPSSGQHGRPPSGMSRPTAGGRITALSGDTVTLQTRDGTSQVVTYASTTTFRTSSGTSTSSALKVGDFVAVNGTTNSDGSVSATSLMISANPPGPMGQGGGGRPPRGQGGPTG